MMEQRFESCALKTKEEATSQGMPVAYKALRGKEMDSLWSLSNECSPADPLIS